jgi:hypothetical protein
VTSLPLPATAQPSSIPVTPSPAVTLSPSATPQIVNTVVGGNTTVPSAANETANGADACANVERVDPTSETGQQIAADFIAVVRALPQIQDDEEIGEVFSVDRVGEWLIIQSNFLHNEAGVFLINQEKANFELVEIWGGITTYPGQIQDYFTENVPAAPAELIDCFEPVDRFDAVE